MNTPKTASATTRTQAEIVARIRERVGNDPLHFEVDEYMPYLTFEAAKPFRKDGTTAEEWGEPNGGPPKQEMVGYMNFAFGKAHGQRGISSSRSLSHMIAWAWLSGDDDLLNFIQSETNNYSEYGLPALRGICERLGIDPKEHGDQ